MSINIVSKCANPIGLIISISTLSLASLNVAHAKKSFPPPPGAYVESVSEKMEYQGFNLNVRKFESSDDTKTVLNFYRRQWQDEFVENDMPPWKMISSKQGDEFYTVQVQSSGDGSWGYLGTSDLPEVLEKRKKLGGSSKKKFPMMHGSQVVNDNTSQDIGKSARTLLITNKFSVPSNANYYRNHYASQGWTPVIDESHDPSKNHVLVFKKGSKSMSLTIDKSDGRTNVVANDVTHGLY